MSQVIYTSNAINGLLEIADFWRKTPEVGKRAVGTITEKIKLLEQFPNIGKPDEDWINRLFAVSFGSGGYVVRYLHDQNQDIVFVLAIRNFRQAWFIQE